MPSDFQKFMKKVSAYFYVEKWKRERKREKREREKRERERRKIGEIGEIRQIREEKRERTHCVRSLYSPTLLAFLGSCTRSDG